MSNPNERFSILLVSNNRALLNATTEMIKKLGYVVLRATNGADANQIFQHNKEVIDLVVLDSRWPDESGSDTCLKLKEIDSGVKIIHLSELGSYADHLKLEGGGSGFIVKPFMIEELSIKIMEMLDNRSTRPGFSICKENFFYDPVHQSQRKAAAG